MSHLPDVEEGAGSAGLLAWQEGMSHLLEWRKGQGLQGHLTSGPIGRRQHSAQAGVPTAEMHLRVQCGGTGHSQRILPLP